MSGSISATTLAYAGLALSAVGTAGSMLGQMQQASAAKASADYQAQVAAGNQQIATQNASFAAAEGEQLAAQKQQQTRAQEGAILAGQGSSGVDINSPTSQAVRASQSELGALDAQTIRANAARKAYGFESQAANFGNAASADTATGENAQTAGEIGAAGSLLSGAGDTAQNYADVMGKASGMGANQVYSSAIGPSYPGQPLGQ